MRSWSSFIDGLRRRSRHGRSHGGDLAPALFVRPLEDRYVLSASALAPHASLAAFIAAPVPGSHAAPNLAAPISIDVIHEPTGIDVAVNGHMLPTDVPPSQHRYDLDEARRTHHY